MKPSLACAPNDIPLASLKAFRYFLVAILGNIFEPEHCLSVAKLVTLFLSVYMNENLRTNLRPDISPLCCLQGVLIRTPQAGSSLYQVFAYLKLV